MLALKKNTGVLSSIAKGSVVVLPAPGGACNTREVPPVSSSRHRWSTSFIGSVFTTVSRRGSMGGPHPASDASDARTGGTDVRRTGLPLTVRSQTPLLRPSSLQVTTRPGAHATEEHDAMSCDETRPSTSWIKCEKAQFEINTLHVLLITSTPSLPPPPSASSQTSQHP